MKKLLWMSSAAVVIGALRVKTDPLSQSTGMYVDGEQRAQMGISHWENYFKIMQFSARSWACIPKVGLKICVF